MTELETERQITAYAMAMWDDDDIIEVRPLPVESVGHRFSCRAADLASHIDTMAQDNANGCGIYTGAIPRSCDVERVNGQWRGGRAEYCAQARAVWADMDDIDIDTAREIADRVGLPDRTMEVSSGGGIHFFWRLTAPIDPAKAVEINRAIAAQIATDDVGAQHIDTGATDAARVLRLPGFRNHKRGSDCEIIRSDADYRHDPASFDAIVKSHGTGYADIKSRLAAPDKYYPGTASERARRYIDRIPGETTGGRTGRVYKIMIALNVGFGIDETTACALAREWDKNHSSPPVCDDPSYPDDEFEKIYQNAGLYRKYDEPGFLLGASRHIDGDPVTFDRRDPPPEMPRGVIDDAGGILADIIDYHCGLAYRRQPEFALASAIATVSVVASRKIMDSAGTRTNIYIMALGPSGSGKDACHKVTQHILEASGCGHLIGCEDYTSDAAILSDIMQGPEPVKIMLGDEFGHLLAAAASQHSTKSSIPACLTKLYSSADRTYPGRGYADPERNKRPHMPCVTILATSIAGNVYKNLRPENIEDGFLPRMCVFHGRDGVRMTRASERGRIEDVPESITTALKWWRDLPGMGNLSGTQVADRTRTALPTVAQVTPEAEAAMTDFCEACDNEAARGGDYAPIWNRAGEKARKLALIHGLSMRPIADQHNVDIDDVNWGIMLTYHLTERMIYDCRTNVAANDEQACANRIMQVINEAGREMKRSEITVKTQTWTKTVRDNAMRYLVDSETLVAAQRGRAEVFYPMGAFAT